MNLDVLGNKRGRMMMKMRLDWKSLVMSSMILVVLPMSFFLLRLSIGATVSLFGDSFLGGMMAGMLLSGLLLLRRRETLLLICSMVLLVIWILIPGEIRAASIVFGAGCVCCVASIPFLSVLLHTTS